jgi:dUTP pyrophosphatase
MTIGSGTTTIASATTTRTTASVGARLTVRVRRLPHGRDLPLPERASPGSAGLDLRAALTEPLRLEPGAVALVPTGFVLEIPPGWEGQVRPRSGLAVRHAVTLANPPGTIDSDYRGELQVALINLGPAPYTVTRGDRIAQLLLAPVPEVDIVEADELTASDRGDGGFGSTGTR